MSLWRLEWLRLVRTRRLVLLIGVFLFFGILGPVTARYLGEILERFGGDVTVQFPPPVPADGVLQFNLNAQQVGLLVVVLVAAGALTLDTIPEMSVFLRARVEDPARLLIPRAVVTLAAVAVSYLGGVLLAGYQTWVLLGPLPWGRLALGAGLGVVYLAFVVALTAAVAGRTSSTVATAGVTVVVLLVLPLLGIIEAVGRWLPSHLVGALDALVREGAPVDYLPSLAVTLVVIGALAATAARGVRTREL